MNLDNERLRDIQQFKAFYHNRLEDEPTELGKDLIEMKLKELETEEKEILKRCKVEI
jgi:hypothetical protein